MRWSKNYNFVATGIHDARIRWLSSPLTKNFRIDFLEGGVGGGGGGAPADPKSHFPALGILGPGAV